MSYFRYADKQIYYEESGEERGIEMKIAVLGLGVIGTTYAYALQKAGNETLPKMHGISETRLSGLTITIIPKEFVRLQNILNCS